LLSILAEFTSAYTNLILHYLSLHQWMTSGNHLDINQLLVMDQHNDTMAAFALYFAANGVVQIHSVFPQCEQK